MKVELTTLVASAVVALVVLLWTYPFQMPLLMLILFLAHAYSGPTGYWTSAGAIAAVWSTVVGRAGTTACERYSSLWNFIRARQI